MREWRIVTQIGCVGDPPDGINHYTSRSLKAKRQRELEALLCQLADSSEAAVSQSEGRAERRQSACDSATAAKGALSTPLNSEQVRPPHARKSASRSNCEELQADKVCSVRRC